MKFRRKRSIINNNFSEVLLTKESQENQKNKRQTPNQNSGLLEEPREACKV